MNLKKLVVHAGGIFPNPALNLEAAAKVDVLPATIVVLNGGKFSASVDGTETGIKYVLDKDYLTCKTIDDVIKTGENAVGIHPLSGMFFNVRAKAGTYTKGDALKINTGMVATGGDATATIFAQETITVATDGELVRVVIK